MEPYSQQGFDNDLRMGYMKVSEVNKMMRKVIRKEEYFNDLRYFIKAETVYMTESQQLSMSCPLKMV